MLCMLRTQLAVQTDARSHGLVQSVSSLLSVLRAWLTGFGAVPLRLFHQGRSLAPSVRGKGPAEGSLLAGGI